MKKILLLLAMVLALGISSQAQNSDHPWLIGASFNYVDFNAPDKSLGEQFTSADWMGKSIPSMIRVGHTIIPSLSASILAANVKLEPAKLNEIPLNRTIVDDQFWKYGVQLEYKFANDYLLKENCWWDPYVYLGMNGSVIDEVTYASSSMGIGMNFWFIDQLGVNFQGSYDYNWDFNDYMHYSFGLVTRFGSTPDMDGDGVPDKRDMCPETFGLPEFDGCPDTDGDSIPDRDDLCPTVPGLPEFFGCPDTDGDGIPDKDDECPAEAGLPEFNGCPDRDGDGVPDKDDLCPDIPGLIEFRGCPDSDGDGIPDNLDQCPNEAGPAQFNGCPDSDGDGVPDNIDRCPNEPGPASNNGCPLPVVPPRLWQDLQFNINSATIKKSSYDELDELVKFMNENPDAKFTVYGYTDITGPADFNLKLSKERANSVKNYITRKGIASNRLEVNGFGTKNPIAPNDTNEGRIRNRRVEVKVKK